MSTRTDQPIRLLLADEQKLLRTGFRLVLGAEPDLDIVGEASDGAEAVELARRLRPDVVLMDIRMPGLDGVAATRAIVSTRPAVRVLILTSFDLDEFVIGALRAGATGFLAKDVPAGDLISAIRTVAAGEAAVAPRILRRLLDTWAHALPDPDATPPTDRPVLGDGPMLHDRSALRDAPARNDRAMSSDGAVLVDLAVLTDREREVLIQVARGLSNAEIAKELRVSETTVKTHVGHLLTKLGLRDRVQAVVLAYESGLVRPGC